MKSFRGCIQLSLIGVAAVAVTGATLMSAYADHDNAVDIPAAQDQGVTKNRLRLKGAKDPGTIRGHCTIVEVVGGALDSPCASQVVVLLDENSVEIERARTTTDGNFEFSGDPALLYRVAPGSKFYELAAPKKPFRGGSSIEVKFTTK